jgi:hypothetical protein
MSQQTDIEWEIGFYGGNGSNKVEKIKSATADEALEKAKQKNGGSTWIYLRPVDVDAVAPGWDGSQLEVPKSVKQQQGETAGLSSHVKESRIQKAISRLTSR